MSGLSLSRPLALEEQERSADGAGGFAGAWITLGTLWAEMRSSSGRRVADKAGPVARARYDVIVRAAPVGSVERPKPGQRFRDILRVFEIEAVREYGTDGRYLVCDVLEEAVR